jgi:glutaminyl-peptide cyclotransferase
MGRLRPFAPVFLCASALLAISLVSSCSAPSASAEPVEYSYKVVKVYPHDTAAFTEGLVMDQGVMYEGTGLNGHSSIRRVDLETGKVLQSYELPQEYFGEGITTLNNSLIQLTWQSHVGFVYDKSSFQELSRFSYPTEGWGITGDTRRLIMSEGTSNLIFLDPKTFASTGTVAVQDRGTAINNINELEFIKGQVYANIWQTNKIAIIDPQSGWVTGWIDLTGLLQTQNYNGQVDVLNGIAYDSALDRLFVTGKYWPYLFQIELVK